MKTSKLWECSPFPTARVFATNYLYRDPDGTYRLPIIRGLPLPPWEGILSDYFGVAARSDPPLCSSAIAVDRKAILSVGGFPVGVTSGEDLLTWARLAQRYPIAYTSEPLAVFWRRAPMGGRAKPRTPNAPDIVGESLAALLGQGSSDEEASLRRYIALWHRMRADSYLRLGRRRDAWQEIRKIARFSGCNARLCLYGAIALFPSTLTPRLMRGVGLLKKGYRGVHRNRESSSYSES